MSDSGTSKGEKGRSEETPSVGAEIVRGVRKGPPARAALWLLWWESLPGRGVGTKTGVLGSSEEAGMGAGGG